MCSQKNNALVLHGLLVADKIGLPLYASWAITADELGSLIRADPSASPATIKLKTHPLDISHTKHKWMTN